MDRSASAPVRPAIGLLTGGGDKPYAFGLATALISRGLSLEIVAGDELDVPEFRAAPGVRFLNLRGDQRTDTTIVAKALRVARYYCRLVHYAMTTEAPILHVLWNNKFEFLDRTLLMLLYRWCGKHVVLTAHNVNAGVRDGNDSALNRATLGVQYRLSSHIFVHTERMRAELVRDFGVPPGKVGVIPFGINNAVRCTDMTASQARAALGLSEHHKAILFFGTIAPYKGLEHLVSAFGLLTKARPEYRLIVAGRPRRGSAAYWSEVQASLKRLPQDKTTIRDEFIEDDDTELYFKAADVIVLPYVRIFQSGVLFLAYSFGLPTLVADVGTLKDDVIDGVTGYSFAPENPGALAEALDRYFASELYANLPRRREAIRRHAREHHSWERVGGLTVAAYSAVLASADASRRSMAAS